jgi:hypothetical protein
MALLIADFVFPRCPRLGRLQARLEPKHLRIAHPGASSIVATP